MLCAVSLSPQIFVFYSYNLHTYSMNAYILATEQLEESNRGC